MQKNVRDHPTHTSLHSFWQRDETFPVKRSLMASSSAHIFLSFPPTFSWLIKFHPFLTASIAMIGEVYVLVSLTISFSLKEEDTMNFAHWNRQIYRKNSKNFKYWINKFNQIMHIKFYILKRVVKNDLAFYWCLFLLTQRLGLVRLEARVHVPTTELFLPLSTAFNALRRSRGGRKISPLFCGRSL